MPAHPSRAIIYLASHISHQNLTRISPESLGPSNIHLDLLKSILRAERMEKRTGNVHIWSFRICRVWKQKNVGKKLQLIEGATQHQKVEKWSILTKITFSSVAGYLVTFKDRFQQLMPSRLRPKSTWKKKVKFSPISGVRVRPTKKIEFDFEWR